MTPKFSTTSGDVRADPVRERLLDAARHVVATSGWASATSRKLAAAADANPALINYYFGSKDALLFATLERCGMRLAASMEGEVNASAVDLICRSLEALKDVDLAEDMRFLVEASAQATRDPRLSKFASEQLLEFRRQVYAALKRDWQAGGVALDPQREAQAQLYELAAAFTALADGLAIHAAIDPSLRAADLARTALRRILSGLAGPRQLP